MLPNFPFGATPASTPIPRPSRGKQVRLVSIAIAGLVCALSLVSCGDSNRPEASGNPPPTDSAQSPSASAPPTDTTEPSPTLPPSDEEDLSDLEPVVGTITAITQGDLMCYISYVDESGQEFQDGAIFELCEQPDQYLNQRLRLVYGIRTVNDCTSNEPCGRTKRMHLVIRMDPVEVRNSGASSDAVVLSDGSWTITVGNRNSWSGVNGTGNLTYRGCNAAQDCIELTGGVMTCRDGICSITWSNGDYTYTLESPISEGSTASSSTLTVRRSGTVLTQIPDLAAL